MNKQFILFAFLIAALLIVPIFLYAEDPDGGLADSFDGLADKVLDSLSDESSGSVIAVLSIRNTDGRDSVLGNYLEQRFVDLLLSNTDLALVERNQIEQLVQEWEYSLSGMLEEDSMYEIGSMAGADAVLVGILTRIDQAVQVNLRIIDPESALVVGSVDSLLTEPRYLSMYLDVFDSDTLTEEDFFIGRGRDFQKDRAFLEAFFNFCHEVEAQTGRSDFLDMSFLEYLEATAEVEFKQGSRQNCTLQVRKDQFEPRYLYNFFFSDGRSQTVWYAEEGSYGWHTNPYFQALVERDFDTLGVPDVYKNAVMRSAAFSAHTGTLDNSSASVSDGRIQCTGSGSTPEWALLGALMEAAILLETKMEFVTIRDDAVFIEFTTQYVSLEHLERISGNIIIQELRTAEAMYNMKIQVDTSAF